MSAKPLPNRTAGKSDRPRGREEAAERVEAAPLNLGCGPLLVLFLLVATAGKFLPHGDKAVKTAAQPIVTPPREPQKGRPTASVPSPSEPRSDPAKQPVPPEPKAFPSKPAASPARTNLAGDFDSLLTQLGNWVGNANRSAPQPSSPVIKPDKPPITGPGRLPSGQPAAPPRAVSGPVPKALAKPELPRSASSPPTAAPASRPSRNPAGSASSEPAARTTDPVMGKAVVFNSPWNQSVAQVERYLKRHAHNADSVEVLEWGKVARVDQGYQVRCTFRSRNVLGHAATQSKVFVLDKSGEVSDIRD